MVRAVFKSPPACSSRGGKCGSTGALSHKATATPAIQSQLRGAAGFIFEGREKPF